MTMCPSVANNAAQSRQAMVARRETFRRRHEEYARLVTVAQPYEGRYVRRLPADAHRRIKQAVEACPMAMPQEIYHQRAGKAPVLCLDAARAQRDRYAECVEAMTVLESLPEVDDYLAALDAFKDASARLREAAAAANVQRIDGFLPIASFSA